jgi:hypothetical protein
MAPKNYIASNILVHQCTLAPGVEGNKRRSCLDLAWLFVIVKNLYSAKGGVIKRID